MNVCVVYAQIAHPPFIVGVVQSAFRIGSRAISSVIDVLGICRHSQLSKGCLVAAFFYALFITKGSRLERLLTFVRILF